MLVKEIMTKAPACCSPETKLSDVARLMASHDCGVVPVCDGTRIVGIITDRDIVCRGFRGAIDPREVAALEVMSAPVVTVNDNETVQHAMNVMAEHQVRRLPVLRDGHLAGILTPANLAEHLPLAEIGSVMRKICAPARRVLALA